MLILYIFIFLISCFLLVFSSKWLIGALSRIALFLKLKEFVVGFFLMAFAVSIPNLVVGVISALNKIPELSFGDVVGGNIIDLTIVIGLAALISKTGISADSQTVQKSSLFTIFIAILPLLLIFDGSLSRGDGILLLLSFLAYAIWLFSKKERFTKAYNHAPKSINFKNFLKDLMIMLGGFILLLLAGEGVVKSASFFSQELGLSLSLIGIFIVGAGNCLPETFFSIQAARKNQDWLILGDLMGAVIVSATLVLGVVVLIHPIQNINFTPFVIARFFLVASALIFLFCLRSGKKITRREAIFLLGVYVLFLLTEILTK